MNSGRFVIPPITTLCTLSQYDKPTIDELQETTGTPDKVRHTTHVGKDRRCDPTFAYQQIMFDVSREVQVYTSRCVVSHLLFICMRARFNIALVHYMSAGQCFGIYKQSQVFMEW